jgi:hypothetical protein
MSTSVKSPEWTANQMNLAAQEAKLQNPLYVPTGPPYTTQQGVTSGPSRDMSKEELWKIAHSADLSSLLTKQPPILTQPQLSRGIPSVPQLNSIPLDELDLTMLGLPTVRGGRRRDRDIPLQDPLAILSQCNNIPDIASRHRSYAPNELEEWPLTDIIIYEDLLFIIIDAPGFDLQTYYFEEAEPDILVMIGQKTHQAALPELCNAPPSIWVFRQRPLGNTFVRKIDLRRFNFRLDPSTLTYGNYNGCMVYRGLREQPVRPKQLFRYH